MATQFVDLDVRPTLRAGGEPFEEIMQAVAGLRPGEGLRLYATFKPVPLFSVLGSMGFTHEAKELEGGDWEILFHPAGAAAQTARKVTRPNSKDSVMAVFKCTSSRSFI